MLMRPYASAVTTLTARLSETLLAIDSAGKLNSHCLCAHPGWPAEKIPVRQAVLFHGSHKSLPLPVVADKPIECHDDCFTRRDGLHSALGWTSQKLRQR